jgi:hypothetical protein
LSDRFPSGSYCQLGVPVHPAAFLATQYRSWVESFHLSRESGFEPIRIEAGDGTNARLASRNRGPDLGGIVADGTEPTHSGHHNPSGMAGGGS